ncbi:MAG: hypothetical protein JJT81_01340, partial [Rubellimicrobium sp.]|nr:hypothetical protein [Rubellimicrobium sp.]
LSRIWVSKRCRTRGTACLFVAHDLAVVAALCDRVAVLHKGGIVETGSTEAVCNAPQHAYTQQLLSAAGGKRGTVDAVPDAAVSAASREGMAKEPPTVSWP